MAFYMQYMAYWPECLQVAESAGGHVMGYLMGKVEGAGERWHGHVTAVTVAPTFRRLGLARRLMDYLEAVSDNRRAYFVDLFVRVSNRVAIDIYTKLGYVVYRRVLGYYSDDEDAFDMRKSLSSDPERKSMIPLKHPMRPDELD